MPFMLDPRAGKTQLVKSFKKNVQAAKKDLIRANKEMDRDTKDAEKQRAGMDAKIDARLVRFRRLQTQMDMVRARYDQVAVQVEDARTIWRNSSVESSALVQRIQNNQFVTEQNNRALAMMDQVLEDEAALEYRADMLDSVAGMVDGEIEIDERTCRVKWRTAPIFINDKFGGQFDVSFGQYDVALSLVQSSIGIRLSSKCERVDPDPYGGNPHPHVSGDHPCLGNAETALTEYLRARDYVMAVVMFTEFLQSYNHDNPYTNLLNYGIPNKWQCPSCSSEEHLAEDCTCPRCPSCGRAFSDTVHVQDCGCCSSCCLAHHVQDPVAAEQLTGINNTGCVIAGVSEILNKIVEAHQ